MKEKKVLSSKERKSFLKEQAFVGRVLKNPNNKIVHLKANYALINIFISRWSEYMKKVELEGRKRILYSIAELNINKTKKDE